MITKITDINKYESLFKKAWNELQSRDIFTKEELEHYHQLNDNFSCLEEYFTRINSLITVEENEKYPSEYHAIDENGKYVALTNPKKGQLVPVDYEYIMLPLDEPVLEINANTREILIPNDFRKSAGVAGDHYAETLIFSIDRFYDYVDLYRKDMQIYIQWSDNAGIDHATPVKMIRYDEKKQKILFGWPLSSEVTSAARTLNFSVRFFLKNENDIIYSLNTRTHTLTIAPALQADLAKVVTETAPLGFLRAITDSPSTRSPEAEIPSFDTPGLNLENIIDVPQTGEFMLKVQAVSGDNGVIHYTRWTVLKEGATSETFIPGELKYESVATPEAGKYDGKTIYYIKPNSDEEKYIKYVGNPEEALVQLYEEYYVYVIDAADTDILGTYFTEATNRIGSNVSTRVASIKATIPGPKPVEYETNLPMTYIIEPANKTLNVELKDLNDKTTYNYAWSHSTNGSTYSDISDNNSPSLELTEPGWYKVTASATRNRDTTEPLPSNVCRVTKPPVAPTVAFENDKVLYDLTEESETQELRVIATVDNIPENANANLYTDELIYTWYGQILNNNWCEITADNAEEYRVVTTYHSINTNVLEVTGVAESGTGDMISYKCAVKNILNGQSSEAITTDTYITVR